VRAEEEIYAKMPSARVDEYAVTGSTRLQEQYDVGDVATVMPSSVEPTPYGTMLASSHALYASISADLTPRSIARSTTSSDLNTAGAGHAAASSETYSVGNVDRAYGATGA
jgi:hypothetical protein